MEFLRQDFIEVLDKHAHIKKKFWRANTSSYMAETLLKVITRRSQLETMYLKTKSQENSDLFKKHRTFYSKLYKEERKNIL